MDIPTTPQRPQMPAMEPKITPPVQPVQPPTPPTVVPVPPQPEEPHHNPRLALLLTLLLLLLLAIGAYAWFAPSLSQPDEEAPVINNEGTINRDGERITVEDSTALGLNLFELPAGLPQEIPLEASTVFESYKTVYHDRGVDQYTVSYTSTSSVDDKWLEYEGFLKSAGYSLIAESTNRQNGTIYGIMGNTGLLVTITEENGKRVVRLNYFVRS